MGFGIDATDQRIVVQDGQGEVAIFAFGRGRIHLDLVVEVEQVQGALTVPHEGSNGDRKVVFERGISPFAAINVTKGMPDFKQALWQGYAT